MQKSKIFEEMIRLRGKNVSPGGRSIRPSNQGKKAHQVSKNSRRNGVDRRLGPSLGGGGLGNKRQKLNKREDHPGEKERDLSIWGSRGIGTKGWGRSTNPSMKILRNREGGVT